MRCSRFRTPIRSCSRYSSSSVREIKLFVRSGGEFSERLVRAEAVRSRRTCVARSRSLAGCASWGGVPDAELPAQPIAINYRTPEEARERAEALRRAERSRPRCPRRRPTLVGSKAYLRADADALGRFLADVFGTDRGVPEAHLGRLALLDPRSGDVAFVEGALRGAVPQAWSRDRGALLFAQPTAPGGRDVQIFEWSAAERTVRRVTVGPPIHSQACYGPDARIVVTAVEIGARRRALADPDQRSRRPRAVRRL